MLSKTFKRKSSESIFLLCYWTRGTIKVGTFYFDWCLPFSDILIQWIYSFCYLRVLFLFQHIADFFSWALSSLCFSWFYISKMSTRSALITINHTRTIIFTNILIWDILGYKQKKKKLISYIVNRILKHDLKYSLQLQLVLWYFANFCPILKYYEFPFNELCNSFWISHHLLPSSEDLIACYWYVMSYYWIKIKQFVTDSATNEM